MTFNEDDKAEPFAWEIVDKAPFLIVYLSGVIDRNCSGAMQNCQAAISEKDLIQVIVSFERVVDVLKAGFPALVMFQKAIRDEKRSLRICSLKPDLIKSLLAAAAVRSEEISVNLTEAFQSLIPTVEGEKCPEDRTFHHKGTCDERQAPSILLRRKYPVSLRSETELWTTTGIATDISELGLGLIVADPISTNVQVLCKIYKTDLSAFEFRARSVWIEQFPNVGHIVKSQFDFQWRLGLRFEFRSLERKALFKVFSQEFLQA